jgi:hypothetical protein
MTSSTSGCAYGSDGLQLRLGALHPARHDVPPSIWHEAPELYRSLLAPFGDLTKGKHLIIVPSGPLTNLPLHVLRLRPWRLGQSETTISGTIHDSQATVA